MEEEEKKQTRQATEKELNSLFVKINVDRYGKEYLMDKFNMSIDEIDKALDLFYSLDLSSIHL